MVISLFSVSLVVATVIGPLFYNAITHQLTVLGIYRSVTFASSSQGIHIIHDTQQCEDIHYYAPGNLLFAACEDSIQPRFEWFPPLGHLDKQPETIGSIHTIDAHTLRSTRLQFTNFYGPLVTHGIDVIPDPERVAGDAVYIFAVNHLGNPEYDPISDPEAPKTRSQIEIFHHVLGTNSVRHVRSVRHELIKTPNDLYAASPHEFYVTNDHYYRSGWGRKVEDLVPWVRWTDVVHVQIDQPAGTTGDETVGVNATIALPNLWAANGLGHGQSSEEILVTSVLGGYMKRTTPAAGSGTGGRTLTVHDQISVDSAIDNPSYYEDPYKTAEDDASGYVLAGLRRVIDLPKTAGDPNATEGVIVWHVRRSREKAKEGWEKKVIFEDDGSNIRSSSAAVLVPIQPKAGGLKEAWLFVTGFISSSAIAVKMQL
ncbi:serum paraoxonase/arylesterase family protein [Aspergillus undulatus]|uniref:serum paraoxonase/arylesterase family protein n=1 Tax=Aspergillus undulatus TaxID=1810928 RepID=UPI003CCDE19C